jgi:hypothetical protein
VIEKIYSKAIECAGCAWSTSLKRTVMGIHIVVLYWCDGTIRIPVGFRLWIPKGKTSYIMDTDTLISAGEVKSRYTSWWVIEECIRYMKQNLELENM